MSEPITRPRTVREEWKTWLVGALWAITMALAGMWGVRIDSRLASIDQTLTESARSQGETAATLRAHDSRITRLERHHP